MTRVLSYAMCLVLAFSLTASAFGGGGGSSIIPAEVDPAQHKIWKGDNPTDEQIKNMSKEELIERFTMNLIEETRGLKFKKLVKSKELEVDEFALEYGGGRSERNLPMGFYRYRDETLYINMASDPKKLAAIRIHETVHALQHQLWGLKETKTTEAAHLSRSVKEGEATALPWQKIPTMKKMMSSFKPNWRRDRQNTEYYKGGYRSQAIMQERSLFDYAVAANFVDKVLTEKDWKAITSMFTDKPVLSTEQVLHPEKYANEKLWDAPTKFDFPDIAKEMGGDWKIQDQTTAQGMSYNTFGEFETMLRYLTNAHTGPVADQVAAGWDGDWYTKVTNGKEGCEIWLTAWDTNDETKEWHTAEKAYFENVVLPTYTRQIGSKITKIETPAEIKGILKEYSKADSEVYFYKYDGGHVYFEISGNLGLFIECTEVATLAKILKTFNGRKAPENLGAPAGTPKNAPAVFNKPQQGRPQPQQQGGQPKWVQGFMALQQGDVQTAKKLLTEDGSDMAQRILPRVNELLSALELAKNGKYDEARAKVKAVRQANERYEKACNTIDAQIDEIEKAAQSSIIKEDSYALVSYDEDGSSFVGGMEVQKPQDMSKQPKWVQGFFLMQDGKLDEAKKMLTEDGSAMALAMVKNVEILMEAVKLAKAGKYDEARTKAKEVKNGRYEKAVKTILDKIDKAEKAGKWEDDEIALFFENSSTSTCVEDNPKQEQPKWAKGFFLMQEGKLEEAKKMLKEDGTPMANLMLVKVEMFLKAVELARAGKYDDARAKVEEVRKSNDRYVKACDVMKTKIDKAEKDGAWPKD